MAQIITRIQLSLVPRLKKLFGIKNLSLFLRKRKQSIEKLVYRRKYQSSDIIQTLQSMGVSAGDTLMVHCAMNNFYNFHGSAEQLIQDLLDYLGPEGTLCMPAYPKDKSNNKVIFDVENDKSAAGYLSEVFRKWPGVRRSYCKEHSVCALGKNAEFLLSEHHLSRIRYDQKSPYYKLSLVNGKSISLGLPKYYIGTIEHVSEALLAERYNFFADKFSKEKTFYYRLKDGSIHEQILLTGSKQPYIRTKNASWQDRFLDNDYCKRIRLSNIWINLYDAKLTINRLAELATKRITIYRSPEWYE